MTWDDDKTAAALGFMLMGGFLFLVVACGLSLMKYTGVI